ncbi:MAG: hypothetical protein COU46_02695, partial [Candidatus Niyogibacteria bacterium CG10_big_fil_rev_8_21_14_0_10_42_19]
MSHCYGGSAENKRDNASKKNYTCPMHPEIVRDREGMCPECGMQLVPGNKQNIEEPENIYTCPMHPEIVRDREGMCPECGMQLVPGKKKRDQSDLDKHSGHSKNIFKNKFIVSLILSIPIVFYSDILEKLFNYTAPAFPGSAFMPFVLAS